jgi:hypothetical protein
LTQEQTAVPGQFYGLPGLTQFMELPDTQTGVTVTGAQASTTNVNSLSQLTQDNIVFWWEMEVAISQTYTAGTGGQTTSPYFPWSYLSSVQLSLQSMYNNVQVDNGIDLYLFEAIWPTRGYHMVSDGNLGGNPVEVAYAAGPPQTGQPYAGVVNENLFATTVSSTPAAMTALNFTAVLPGSFFFDEYWDLDMGGNLMSNVAVPATVSPQYMAGAARQVTPKIVLASGSVADRATGPFTLTGNATLTFAATFTMRRVGLYATENVETDPVVYNWQYQRISKSYPINGSPFTVKIDESAQVLGMFLRFWDPVAQAPIDVANINKITLSYGGTLARFQDTPLTMQKRFFEQHRLLLPQGVLCWDLSLDPDGSGKLTNAYCLNTMVTANPTITIEWVNGYTPGANSKVVIGYHELKYVVAQ